MKDNPNYASNSEVIICDEAHSIGAFPTYSPQPNFASIARNAICEAAANPNIMVVGITATSEPLEKLACLQHFIPIDTAQLRQYENHSIEPYSSQIVDGKLCRRGLKEIQKTGPTCIKVV